MSMKELMAAGNSLSLGDTPEGVSFDGSNDYLSRSSDLTGNADGKTFTFSAWVYHVDSSTDSIYTINKVSDTFSVGTSSSAISIYCKNSAGTIILNSLHGMTNQMYPKNTWFNLLVSIDMSNPSNRYVYINDQPATSSSWMVYSNDSINFTDINHAVGGTNKFKGRLAHVFLDYTYRDLSVESNRRLFIDSDGKPSSTIPSSPILYLPMTDAATAGSNSGTGGDFTVNGVLDTAGRAPNQWNCSASTFDGSADYLSSLDTTTTGTNSKVFTLAFNAKSSASGYPKVFALTSGLEAELSSERGKISITANNSAGTEILNIHTGSTHHFEQEQNVAVVISVDMASQSNTKIYLNGTSLPITFYTFTDDTLKFTGQDWWVGRRYSGSYLNGSIGEVYFDTSYTDLATSNPFWDSDANRPKPVRQVISETGTTPLIALPMRADDAGNNLGSGGDFTANSAPYTGARGGSEFWARSATVGSSNYFQINGPISGVSDNKTGTCVIAFKQSSTATQDLFELQGNYSGNRRQIFHVSYVPSSGSITVKSVRASDASDTLDMRGSATFTTGSWNIIMICFDLSNAARRFVHSNGSNVTDNVFDFVDRDINYSTMATTGGDGTRHTIGAKWAGSYSYATGDVSFLYFNNSYIDFSQESNRNLFIDQLGYPKDLTPAIDAGDIADPLIYMKFDDTSALGTNSGTGGNFTVNGTVTAGADVDPNA
jgi:hypothetical protein